jgi:hypothetical protein
MFGVSGLIVTMAAMAGGSVSSLIFVSEFTRGKVADEAKKCHIARDNDDIH